jgi:hypothetical protein
MLMLRSFSSIPGNLDCERHVVVILKNVGRRRELAFAHSLSFGTEISEGILKEAVHLVLEWGKFPERIPPVTR